MALTQLNFRLPLWQKRKMAQFADDDGKTMEGFLQDAINDIFDSRVDELEAEARILTEFAERSRTQSKYPQ